MAGATMQGASRVEIKIHHTRPFFICMYVLMVSVFCRIYSLDVLNNVSLVIITELNQTLAEKDADITKVHTIFSALCGVVFLGALISNPFAGILADRFGRKTMMFMVPGVIRVIANILQMAACPTKKFVLLGLGQFICGMSNGITAVVTLMYLLEFAPPQYHGSILGLYTLLGTTGNLVAQVFGLPQFFGTEDRWWGLFLIPLVLAILEIFGQFFMPESPAWLMDIRNNVDEARASLRVVYHKDSPETIDRLLAMATAIRSTKRATADWKTIFYYKPHRRAIMCVTALTFLSWATGVYTFQNYSTILFHSFGLSSYTSQLLTVGWISAAFVERAVSVVILSKFKTRKLLFGALGLTDLCMIALTVAPLYCRYSDNWGATIASAAALFLTTFWFKMVFTLSYGLPANISPIHLRGRSVGLARFLVNIGIVLIRVSFVPLYLDYIWSYIFIIFIALPLPFVIWLYFELPETRNKTAKDVAAYWKTPSLFFPASPNDDFSSVGGSMLSGINPPTSEKNGALGTSAVKYGTLENEQDQDDEDDYHATVRQRAQSGAGDN